MKIGVLALQGAFIEHVHILRRLGVDAMEVRLPADLQGVDGLIIPGGESTTIGKLAVMYDLMDPLRAFAADKPVWGTCAGMIFMAKEIQNGRTGGKDQPLLGMMDILVERNAFGRQVDSFEADLDVPALTAESTVDNRPFPTVFIRAPRLVEAGDGVQVLAELEDGTAVAARQDDWLVTSFHPELTNDTRFHEYFLRLVQNRAARPTPTAESD